jgi:hypothetical protein
MRSKEVMSVPAPPIEYGLVARAWPISGIVGRFEAGYLGTRRGVLCWQDAVIWSSAGDYPYAEEMRNRLLRLNHEASEAATHNGDESPEELNRATVLEQVLVDRDLVDRVPEPR